MGVLSNPKQDNNRSHGVMAVNVGFLLLFGIVTMCYIEVLYYLQ